MEASESSGQSRPGQSGAMLPTIGKVGGQQTPARSRERPHSRAGSGRGKSATARRAVSAIALTDSEDSSFGESEVDSPAKPTRGPSAQYRASSAGKARGAPSSASMGRRGGGSPHLNQGWACRGGSVRTTRSRATGRTARASSTIAPSLWAEWSRCTR